jgi:hypothetical protein
MRDNGRLLVESGRYLVNILPILVLRFQPQESLVFLITPAEEVLRPFA